jgi:hypothetical protein
MVWMTYRPINQPDSTWETNKLINQMIMHYYRPCSTATMHVMYELHFLKRNHQIFMVTIAKDAQYMQ